MPKEVIYGERIRFSEPFVAGPDVLTAGDPPPPIDTVVEVRWDRESEFVQVVSRGLDPATHEPYLHDDEWQDAVDLAYRYANGDRATMPGFRNGDIELVTPNEERRLLDYLVKLFGHGLTVADGYFVTLERRAINDLIRQLRRARDAAYGRDE